MKTLSENRLRRQDVGLKTQLDRLDRQISKLQLDVRRRSAEGPDSDSRPSSGFYELSDGGSCSLSASCTSVCSDRLSSSLGALLPAAPAARTSTGACRPWSADETTVGGGALPVWRRPAAEGRAGRPLQGTARPRPVSTGDLDRVLPAEAGLPKANADAWSTSLLCRGLGLPPHALDPKYQRDLVSRGGGEVYPFPSPLHAVALQSPLFALTKETPQGDSHLPPASKSPPGPSGPGSVRTGPALEAGSAQAYIDKLLGLWGHRGPLRGRVGEQGPPSQRAESGGCPERPTCSPRRADAGRGAQGRETGRSGLQRPGPAALVGPPHPSSLSQDGHNPSGSCGRVGAILGSPQLGGASPSRCSWAQQATPEDWRGKARPPPKAPSPCVHPNFAASGAALMGLKMGPKAGHPLAKAVRMGRGACDRAPGPGRQPPPWGALLAPQRPPAWGAWLRGRPTQAREAPGRSCSETSLYPVSFLVPLLVASREGHRASAQALFPLEAAPLAAAGGEARRRQRRWRSSVEIAAGALLASAQGPGPGPPRPATRRGAGPRPVCSRARPRPARRAARAARAGSGSGGSERSAEGASLLHSAVAETSGDEASDHTANRFGDQESSGSDAEDSGQGAGGCPPQPPRAPAGPRPPLPAAPRPCRVKASKALKKKIRRFQPAALKVMTLV
ncbi:dapper homolog 2 isoform 2-T2 [Glossophaga mutica]